MATLKPADVRRSVRRPLPVRVLFLILWPVLIVTLLASTLMWRATRNEIQQALTADVQLRTENLARELEFLFTLEPDNQAQLNAIVEQFIAAIRADRRVRLCTIRLAITGVPKPLFWQSGSEAHCRVSGLMPAVIELQRPLHYVGQFGGSSLTRRLGTAERGDSPATLGVTASPILAETGFYRTLVTGLALVLAVTALALAVGWRHGRSLVRGLHELTAMVAAVARGERNLNATPREIPELDRIAEALASMARDLGVADERLQAALEQERERARSAMKQLQEAHQRTQEAAEAQSQFLARVSHELRTPLYTLLVLAEDLHDHGEASDRENRQRLLDCAEDLRRTVDDLLELQRIRQAHYAPRLEPVDLSSLIQRQVTLAASGGGVEIRVRIDAALPDRLLTDERAIGIVLRNLLSNACRHGAPPIEVQALYLTHQDPPLVELAVADHGSGLPPASLERVFEPFVQAKSGDAAGTGLGLALVRNYARALGGSASAENRASQGVRFAVRWPAREARDPFQLPYIRRTSAGFSGIKP